MSYESNLYEQERPWGSFTVIYASERYWTKILNILPGQRLSLQLHHHRSEFWTPIDEGLSAIVNGGKAFPLEVGTRYDVMPRVLHRIINDSSQPCRLIEVASGRPDEGDIERIHDQYGRGE